jgi:hypothetical protein
LGPQALKSRTAATATRTAERGSATFLFLLIFEIEFQRIPVIVYPSLAVQGGLIGWDVGLGEGDLGAIAF